MNLFILNYQNVSIKQLFFLMEYLNWIIINGKSIKSIKSNDIIIHSFRPIKVLSTKIDFFYRKMYIEGIDFFTNNKISFSRLLNLSRLFETSYNDTTCYVNLPIFTYENYNVLDITENNNKFVLELMDDTGNIIIKKISIEENIVKTILNKLNNFMECKIKMTTWMNNQKIEILK